LIFSHLPPRMLLDLLNRDSFFRVYNENLLNKVFNLLRNSFYRTITSWYDFLVEFWSFSVHKRQSTANHGIQYDSTAPNVDKLGVVWCFTLNHFRRSITRRPACRSKPLTCFIKIQYLWSMSLIDWNLWSLSDYRSQSLYSQVLSLYGLFPFDVNIRLRQRSDEKYCRLLLLVTYD